jgi:hypothetical protein
MIIYDKVQRFDSITGKPVDKWIQKEIRCDYTGRVLDYDDFGPESYCTYNLNYGDHDPCFGAGGPEYQLGQDFKIDVFPFMSQEYHFYSNGGDSKECHAEWQMMTEAMKHCKDSKSEWHRCYTFDAICRQARVRTARKLIESKEITPEQLEEHR